jgi:type IV pilus assembly protein PilV
MRKMQAPSRRRQGGVMLLEVLIGILIFSIGILAMLGMQAIGMRNTVEAKYRAEASYLANQIVGTMWVDRDNLAQYDTVGGAGNSRLTAWTNLVQQRLPQATGANAPSIVVTATNQVTVTLRWLRPGEAAADASSYVVIAQINGPG